MSASSLQSFNTVLSSSWPFQEARTLLEKYLCWKIPPKGYVLFETGYGPSGLPHIGTFSEVIRTTMVRQAFQYLAPHMPTRLFVFSDDMDALRKIPEGFPNSDMLIQHLGRPLTSIPDPFDLYESFGHYNNAQLRALLDTLKISYTFVSATECYQSGRFDRTLRDVLTHYDTIMSTIVPTLSSKRQVTYSPFLPICPQTGLILQVPTIFPNLQEGTIIYNDPHNNQKVEIPVTGGHCKLQWKVDWGMRWHAFDVDYEMSGKDLVDSVQLSNRICRILGGHPPEWLTYELFLDEYGHKISKSKGNGLSIEKWLRYAPIEALVWYIYQKPKTAKRLYFDIIPRTVDEYVQAAEKFLSQTEEERLTNPIWYIHTSIPLPHPVPISFNMLLNLISVCHTSNLQTIWYYISRYVQGIILTSTLEKLINYAIIYYQDLVLPTLHYRSPSIEDRAALTELQTSLLHITYKEASVEALQTLVYNIGKKHSTSGNLQAWFRTLYQILLGQEEGPRIGSFIALYGISETAVLIQKILLEHRES